MSVVYVTSDWHLGHRNIPKMRNINPPWSEMGTEGEQSEYILNAYRKTVKERDIVWFLGDILFDDRYVDEMINLPGTKHLVLGNHDLERGGNFRHLHDVFDKIHGFVKYKKAWLSHCPIHPVELRGKINIHGHTHNWCIYGKEYYNACVDVNPQILVKYQDIMNDIKTL